MIHYEHMHGNFSLQFLASGYQIVGKCDEECLAYGDI